MLDRRAAPRVHEHGHARFPRLEEHERERLEGGRRDEQRRTAQQSPLGRVVDLADLDDVGMHGHGTLHRPDDGKRERPGVALLVASEERREQMRALAVVDAAEAEQVRARLERARSIQRGRRGWRVDAEAYDDLRLGDRGREALLGDGSLPLGVEGKAAGRLEDIVEERQADRGLVVRRGMQHGAVAHERQPQDSRVVQIRRERQQVVVARTDRFDQTGRDRSLLVDPVEAVNVADLLGSREQVQGEATEVGVALLGGGEAVHRHAVLDRGAGLVLVRPCPHVTRTGGERLDRPTVERSEVLREHPRSHLGAAEDVRAVSRRHERELHESTGAIASRNRARVRSSVKSCRRHVPAARSWERERGVSEHPIDRRGDERRRLVGQADSGVGEGLGHRSDPERDDRHTEVHALQQRHAEALVFGEAHVDVRGAVVGGERSGRHGPGHRHALVEAELAHERSHAAA